MYILWVFWHHLKNFWHCFSSCLSCLLPPYYFIIIFTKWHNGPQIKLFLSYFYPNDQFLQYANWCSIQELKWFYNQINIFSWTGFCYRSFQDLSWTLKGTLYNYFFPNTYLMSHEYCSMKYSLRKAALYLLHTYFVFQSRTVFKWAKKMFLDFCLPFLAWCEVVRSSSWPCLWMLLQSAALCLNLLELNLWREVGTWEIK